MTIERINYASGVPWEPLRGYSRAVAVGDTLYISGTTAVTADRQVISVGDAYGQLKYIIENIRNILHQADFRIDDVVRTRLFITSMADWDAYARAHSEAFDHIRPASSIVQVNRLIDPRLMVEMEAEAVRGVTARSFRKI